MRKRGYGLGSGVGEVKSKMNNSWPKNRATSRRSGQRRDVRGNVTMLQSVELNEIATFGATSRRYRELD